MIQPGGDPDAGMPADQAEIHGIEREEAPEEEHSHAPKDDHSHAPMEDRERDPPVTDSLDNIDDDVIDPGNLDSSNVTHPPDSD